MAITTQECILILNKNCVCREALTDGVGKYWKRKDTDTGCWMLDILLLAEMTFTYRLNE